MTSTARIDLVALAKHVRNEQIEGGAATVRASVSPFSAC